MKTVNECKGIAVRDLATDFEAKDQKGNIVMLSELDESETLPIPGTFIIGKDGKVKYRHFDPDYKKRLGVDEILQNL